MAFLIGTAVLIDASKYELKDKEEEKKIGITLADSLRLWRDSEHGVFHERSFHVCCCPPPFLDQCERH